MSEEKKKIKYNQPELERASLCLLHRLGSQSSRKQTRWQQDWCVAELHQAGAVPEAKQGYCGTEKLSSVWREGTRKAVCTLLTFVLIPYAAKHLALIWYIVFQLSMHMDNTQLKTENKKKKNHTTFNRQVKPADLQRNENLFLLTTESHEKAVTDMHQQTTYQRDQVASYCSTWDTENTQETQMVKPTLSCQRCVINVTFNNPFHRTTWSSMAAPKSQVQTRVFTPTMCYSMSKHTSSELAWQILKQWHCGLWYMPYPALGYCKNTSTLAWYEPQDTPPSPAVHWGKTDDSGNF